jgi:hypothetical protein
MNAIETREVPITVENDPPDDIDPVAVDVMYTVYATTELLEEIGDAVDAGTIDPTDPPAPLTQAYIDALEDVIRCWQTLQERDDYDEFLKDVSVLDEAMLSELRGTVVYVGQHFGIDIDLPAPDETAGGDR